MSSRLSTRLVRRSVSSSTVSRNSAVSSGVHVTSGWRRLLTDALIPASGVRRSWDTACRSALRSSFASARAVASAACAWRRRRSRAADEVGGEGVEHPAVLGGEVATREREHEFPPTAWTSSASRGRAHADAIRRLDCPPSVVPPQQRDSREPEGSAEVRHQRRERIGVDHAARQRRQRLGLGARSGGFGGSTGREPDEPADDEGGHEVHAKREHVLPVGDRQVWIGGVKYQFTAGTREAATIAGASPPMAASTITNSRYSTITVGRPSCRAAVRARAVSRGSPTSVRIQAIRRRRGATAAPPPRSVRQAAQPRPARLVGDDVDIDRPRQSDDAVDDRALRELVPTALAAAAEDELGRVLGAGEVDECGRDVASGDLVVLAAHLLEQLAVEREELGAGSGQALLAARRARRAARRGPAGRCREARRMRSSVPGAPVIATTTRSRVSQGW